MPESWQRHDLLRVEPQGWSRVLRLQPRLATVPYVTRWAAQGWPLIVRRSSREDVAEMIPVALPLPPVCGKLRIAAQVAAADVIKRLPPQTLRAVRGEVPLSWQLTVDAVLEVAEQIGVEPRVFGSLLWQGLTGLPYLSATSDLDLLWPVTNPECATRLVNQLAAIEENILIRLDGELILPAGGEV
jgi:phosphoribosyl-dephospho-CoA transferase